MSPEAERLRSAVRIAAEIPADRSSPVAIGYSGSPARRGAAVVAGQRFVAVLVGVDRGRDTAEVISYAPDLGVVDKFLTLEHAAEKQADDNQYDGDFDQGEA